MHPDLAPCGRSPRGSVHDVHVGLQGSVELLDLVHGQVQHRVSGGVVVVDPGDLTLTVHAAPHIRTRDTKERLTTGRRAREFSTSSLVLLIALGLSQSSCSRGL